MSILSYFINLGDKLPLSYCYTYWQMTGIYHNYSDRVQGSTPSNENNHIGIMLIYSDFYGHRYLLIHWQQQFLSIRNCWQGESLSIAELS